MIALANVWCWLRGRPPKWTHLNLTEAFPVAANMTPAGGTPPPDAEDTTRTPKGGTRQGNLAIATAPLEGPQPHWTTATGTPPGRPSPLPPTFDRERNR